MSEIYKKEYNVLPIMRDFHDNLKISSILDLTQETSAIDATNRGIGYKDFLNKGYLWFIVANKVDVYKTLDDPKFVTVTTQAFQGRHMQYPRINYIYYKEELVAKITSIWVIYSIKEKRMVDVPNLENNTCETKVFLETMIKRQKLTHKIGEFVVPLSYCDHNKHMNNVRYLDVYCDSLKLDQQPKNIIINYHNQAKMNDCIDLYSEIIGNERYFTGKIGDELIFSIKEIL